MEIGIDRFLFSGRNSPSGVGTNPVPDFLEEVEVADKAGIDVFALGEHHTAEFADSSPAIMLAAAAARTSRIRLSSGISILSVADPVRVMEDFASLDLVSNGRAEIIAGRGAYAEAFSLFGADMTQYEALATEKLDLLLKLRSGAPMHWNGRFRPPLHGEITYPRPLQKTLPVWVGATGSPETFVRAGTLGLPLALAVLGGPIRQLRPFVDLYREAGESAGYGRDRLRVAVHTLGFLGETSEAARSAFFPGYLAIFGAMASRMGRPPVTRREFDAMTGEGQAILVGTASEVSAKCAELDYALGGVHRVCLQMTVGPIGRTDRLRAIELLGTVSVSPQLTSQAR